MQIERIDHLVLNVRDIEASKHRSIEASCHFYSRVLGMKVITFGDSRKALAFGAQKINLHLHGQEFEPKAAYPTPGSADLCLISSTPISAVLKHLAVTGVSVIEGPVQRTGATGAILSVYFRDPDSNLIEISNYPDA